MDSGRAAGSRTTHTGYGLHNWRPANRHRRGKRVLPDTSAAYQEGEDIGVTQGWLYDTNGHSVHILSIRFVSPPASLHMLNVIAYSFADTHHTGILRQLGVSVITVRSSVAVTVGVGVL